MTKKKTTLTATTHKIGEKPKKTIKKSTKDPYKGKYCIVDGFVRKIKCEAPQKSFMGITVCTLSHIDVILEEKLIEGNVSVNNIYDTELEAYKGIIDLLERENHELKEELKKPWYKKIFI